MGWCKFGPQVWEVAQWEREIKSKEKLRSDRDAEEEASAREETARRPLSSPPCRHQQPPRLHRARRRQGVRRCRPARVRKEAVANDDLSTLLLA